MFGLGPTELIVILVLALVVLGPQRIPEVASSLGKAIRGFRKATRELREQIDIEDDVRRPFEDLRAALRDEPQRYVPPAPPQLVTVAGDHNFPTIPIDPNYVPTGHGAIGAPVFPTGPSEPFAPLPTDVLGAAPGTEAGHAADPAAVAAAPPPATSVAAEAPAAAPAEPVVSADAAAEHFRLVAQGTSPIKGAS